MNQLTASKKFINLLGNMKKITYLCILLINIFR